MQFNEAVKLNSFSKSLAVRVRVLVVDFCH
jgi:hypothetical protein